MALMIELVLALALTQVEYFHPYFSQEKRADCDVSFTSEIGSPMNFTLNSAKTAVMSS